MNNKILIFLFLALFLNSCQENKNQVTNNFSFEKPILNIGNNELVNLYFESDTIKVKYLKPKNIFPFIVKKRKKNLQEKKV